MAAMLIRNIDDDVKAKLKARAKRNGRSLEAEVRNVLLKSARTEPPAVGLGSQIRAMFSEFDAADLDLELPPRQVSEPIDFEE